MFNYRLFDELDNHTHWDREWRPACDVEETKDHFLLSVEMPGIAKDDIKLEVVDDHITITGEKRKKEKHSENGHWYRERSYGKFTRTFSLPAGTKADSIEADYSDGVLSVLIPKAETIKPRQIKIGESSQVGLFKKLLGERSKSETVERAAS